MKIKRAFLIYPPTGLYMRDDRCQAPTEGMTAQPHRAPMDLAYMAASLEKAGVECRIKDYPSEKEDWENLTNDIKVIRPDMLVISIITPTIKEDLKACKVAKDICSDILTVSKGAHYMKNDDEVLNEWPDLDIVIRGECEFAVSDLLMNDNLSDVPGIAYRENGSVLKTKDRPLLEDLDSLPFPARHLLNNNLYITPDTREPIAFIHVGRGCPHKCIFCAVPAVSGYKFKIRSPESVLEEIKECITKYGIKVFFFRSDTFTMDKKWVIKFCELVVREGLKIRWGTNSRVDTIDEERLEWMKKAGCWIVGFGVESGNQEMLDKMKKGITVEQTEVAVKLCRKYKIKTYLLFVLGLPWETMETAMDTIEFAKKLDGDFVDFNIAYPLPGTEYYEIAKESALCDLSNLSGFDYANPLVKSFHLSTDELVELRKKALKSFYFRPRYVARTLLNIRSMKVFNSYLYSGLRLLYKSRN